MIKLKIQKEPYWLDLGYGVKVFVKPCTSAVFYEAKAFMNGKIADMANLYKAAKAVGQVDKNLPDLENPIKREAYADQQLILGLAIAGILDWEGVLDSEKDEKAILTQEKVEELFSNFWVIAENFRQQYCGVQEILAAEKNASTSVLDGTLVTEEATVKDVEKKGSSAHSQSAIITQQR
ncbi:MAG: hypothetical protein ACK5N8_04570 [Alphaproteobacteria bacterium]